MLASTSLSSVVSLAASALRYSSSPPRVRPEVEVLSALTPLLSSPRFDVNRQNREGDTLLHTAARNNHARVVELLLQRCPRLVVDLRNSGGFTPLDFAGRSGNLPIMLALIAAGADPSNLTQQRNSKVGNIQERCRIALPNWAADRRRCVCRWLWSGSSAASSFAVGSAVVSRSQLRPTRVPSSTVRSFE